MLVCSHGGILNPHVMGRQLTAWMHGSTRRSGYPMVSSRRRRCLRQDELAGPRRRQDRRPHRSGPGADQSTPVRPVRQSAMTRRMLRPVRARPRGLILAHRLGPYPSRALPTRAMRPDDHGAYPLPTGPKPPRGPSPGDPGRSGRCKSTTQIDGQRAHAGPTAPSSHPDALRPPTAVAGSRPLPLGPAAARRGIDGQSR